MGAFGKCGALLAGRHFARSARHHAAAAAAASAPQHAAAPMFLEEDEVRAAAPTLDCRVGSHTEWDPLEEVIVGRIDGARIPEATSALEAVVPERYIEWFRENGGQPYAAEAVQAAAQELDHLSEVLRQEGVEVRRPEVMDFSVPYKTPDFECTGGMYAAMPRDVLLVVGNEIIEAPMAWRSRYFEFRSYRRLIKEYFKTGARWTAAPKPQMADSLYRGIDEWVGSGGEDAFVSIVTEDEPVFDAAEFTRFGRDLFVQRSHVTNEFGIEWMRRHLGDEYNITVLDFDDRNGMHIDGTFVPIGEGKLLINPARPCLTGSEKSWYTYNGEDKELSLPSCFKGWDVFFAPKPSLPASHPLYFTSPWTATANVLVIDSKRVIVEAHEEEAIKRFKDWGFTPVPVPFRSFLQFGGSFHCATCDVRRRGELRSVF
eukprot:Rhum_TRINITY_DN4396_c0_g1::Rhum_TRINITY_DN4396_c0_g1_i1::g.14162::m.14162/K00613/GATM; glycine amidinotransferase